MMNEFGVPMGDAEMNMQPIKPHERMMAESGVESGAIWNVVGAVAGIGLGLFGAKKSSDAAKDQAEFINDARDKQFEYDNKAYDMTAEQIKAKHAFAVKETATKRLNENNVANWKDATNAANYLQQLSIRNREQASLEAQYEKSNVLYRRQVGYNDRVARHAEEAEWRKLDEVNSEAAFDAQEQRIKHLQEEGAIRARGQTGRSVAKTHQSLAANFGQQIAALNEGLEGAGRNTSAMLKEIKNDRYSANLAAWANRMMDPGELPMPVMPFDTPRAVFMDPQPLEEFHFGPRPIKGAGASTSAAAGQAWGAAIPGIASSVVSLGKALM